MEWVFLITIGFAAGDPHLSRGYNDMHCISDYQFLEPGLEIASKHKQHRGEIPVRLIIRLRKVNRISRVTINYQLE